MRHELCHQPGVALASRAMDTVLLVLVRPLFMLVLLAIATAISMLLHRIIPDGPIKRVLYKRRKLY
jgi:hypothetical protein